MRVLEIESASVSDKAEFENLEGYSNVTRRLACFSLKNVQGEYRFWVYYNPNLEKWRTNASHPVHIKEICSICEENGESPGKGHLCKNLRQEDLKEIWSQMEEYTGVKLKLLF